TQVGTENWHIQPKYKPVELVAGQMYTIQVAVRGNNQQPLTMSISQDYSPWGMVDVRQSTTLTSDWQILEQTFIASTSDANLRIIFNGFAKLTGYVDIAGLTFRTGGSIGSIPEETSLESRNIPWLRLADNDPGAPKNMMHDWFRFLLQREQRYIQEMETHIRDTIGYPGIILSTQMGYAPAEALVNLSAADGHAYWDHPHFPETEWDPYDWYIINESMVNSAAGTVGNLAKRRVKGIPYFISEYQHAFPNTYSTEAPVLIGAYAALQNWDGIYFFNYGNSHDDWDRGFFDQYFDTSQHPGNMANLLLGAALFRRGDAKPANQVFSYSSPTDTYFDQITGKPYGGWVSGVNELPFDEKNALLHRLEIDPDILNADASGWPPDTNSNAYGSDTGELVWDQSNPATSFVQINTSKTKALVGFINGRSFDFGGIQISPKANRQDWLTLGLIAMNSESILSDTGSNCLLIATGECSNTGMQWNAESNSLINNNWGSTPSLIEVVPADIALPVQPWRVRVWALDATGARSSELTVTNSNNLAKFSIGSPYQTLWYEVEVSPLPVIHSSIQVESNGAVDTTTVEFTVDQPIDQSRLLLQSSTDMSNWFNLPDESIQWQTSQDSLNATTIVEENHGTSATKYFRAEILN
ncbi:MAG: carbohydrate binding domain-containing protein, partial [Synechococcaceae cyanobacterium]|nr:carbohydrate binding domain-containing protein [Synechococcaceae cyanobacterium]